MVLGPGDLKPFFGKKEAIYGTTPTGTLDFFGEAIDATLRIDPHQTKEVWSDSRAYAPSSCVFEQEDAAVQLNARLHAPAEGYDWRNGLVEGALGVMSGTTPLGRLPSYSMLVELTQGPVQGLYMFNGSKVKTLTVDVPNQGAKPLLTAEVWARKATKVGAGRAVTGLQQLTLGANGTIPASPALQWKAPVTLISGATRTIYPQSWKLIIENNLTRQQGSIVGADGKSYPCTQALFEGRLDISLEMMLYLEDLQIIDEMMVNQAVASWSTSIGGRTLSLLNGHYAVDSGAWPQFAQDTMQHTVKLMFTGVSLV